MRENHILPESPPGILCTKHERAVATGHVFVPYDSPYARHHPGFMREYVDDGWTIHRVDEVYEVITWYARCFGAPTYRSSEDLETIYKWWWRNWEVVELPDGRLHFNILSVNSDSKRASEETAEAAAQGTDENRQRTNRAAPWYEQIVKEWKKLAEEEEVAEVVPPLSGYLCIRPWGEGTFIPENCKFIEDNPDFMRFYTDQGWRISRYEDLLGFQGGGVRHRYDLSNPAVRARLKRKWDHCKRPGGIYVFTYPVK